MTYDLTKFNLTQKRLLVFLAGALANLAFAPFDFFPILILSFPIFLLVLEAATTRKQAFYFSWWFGFGHFLAGLYWISNALLVDADKFAWLIPFASAGIPLFLAVFVGLLGLAYHSISRRYKLSQWARVVMFINIWILAEFARNYAFTGFPWNLIGYSLLFNDELAQIASIGGVFLASWVALYLAFAPVLLRNKAAITSIVIMTALLYFYGGYRIENTKLEAINKTAKLIQPNTKQSLQWNPETARKNFQIGLDLMLEGQKADYYIWAEATGGYHLNRSQQAVAAISEATQDGYTVVGADRAVGDSYDNYQIWNSMYVISKNGIEDVYDKQHLVPFGEYVPLSDVLPLEKITYGMVDFSSGNGARQVSLGNLKALPLICYEAIFTNYTAFQPRIEEPSFVINITNDAWFGDSIGPYQHLAMVRMRAIESGMPILRTAKTGISAIIDSFGIIINSLDLNKKGSVFSVIPERQSLSTFYEIFGYLPIAVLLLSSSIIITFFRNKK